MADGDGVRRTYIVRTAAALFSSHGYTSTSIREVAAAVGLSKPGLYHYFPTKEAIFEEIAEGAIESLLAHLELIDQKGLYYAMWRQQIGERREDQAVGAPALAGVRR